jgi:hypothetical protein
MVITPHRLAQSMVECARALGSAHIPFAVAGAFAVAMHGYVRATRDIDFLVRSSDRDAAVAALERLGYRCIHSSNGLVQLERLPLPELPGVVERVDLLLSAHDIGHRAIETAMGAPMAWQRERLPVVPLETLIMMKLMAVSANPRRLQDLVDVRALLMQSNGRLDVDAMRGIADWMGIEVRRLLDAELSRPPDHVADVAGGYGAGGLGI